MSTDLEATRALLADIQRDPTERLSALTRSELIQLFSTFVESEDHAGASLDLRSSAYLALSSFVASVRPPEASSPEKNDAATQTLVSCFAPAVEEALRGTDIQPTLSTLAFLVAFFQVDSQAAVAIFCRDGLLDSLLDILEVYPSSNGPGGTDVRIARALAALFSHAAGQKGARALLDREGDSRAVRWLRSQISATDTRLKSVAGLALTKLYRGRLQGGDTGSGIPTETAEPSSSKSDEAELVKLLQGVVLEAPDRAGAHPDSSITDAIEGLAYLSVEPPTKERIARDKPLLQKLFKLALYSAPAINKQANINRQQEKSDPRLSIGLHYGLAVIIANLCAYRPKLSGEEEQVARLKRMAKAPLGSGSGANSRLQDVAEDPLGDDKAVQARIKLLLTAGVLPILSALARSDSATARASVAAAYLAIVEQQANRGAVLQHGGSKALMHIIQSVQAMNGSSKALPDFNAIQALSKLAITASPLQVFGPDPGATHDAIAPLSNVLVTTLSSSSPLLASGSGHQQPSSLQRFEAMMALTNIASMGAPFAARIMAVPRLFASLETLLLDDNTLTRRAAMELLCNLIVSDEGFQRYVPTSPTSTSTPSSPPPTANSDKSPPHSPKRRRPERTGTGYGMAESRLQILVALSDVEDLPTRKAASGALAMLTSDEDICGVLVEMEKKRGRVISIFGRLLIESNEEEDDETEDSTSTATNERPESTPEPQTTTTSSSSLTVPNQPPATELQTPADPALIHRGVVCLRNLIVLFAAKRKPGTDALLEAIAREDILTKVEMVVKLEMEKPPGEGDRPSPVVEAALELVLGLKNSVPE